MDVQDIYNLQGIDCFVKKKKVASVRTRGHLPTTTRGQVVSLVTRTLVVVSAQAQTGELVGDLPSRTTSWLIAGANFCSLNPED